MKTEFCISRELLEEVLNFIESQMRNEVVGMSDDGEEILSEEGEWMDSFYDRIRDESGHEWR